MKKAKIDYGAIGLTGYLIGGMFFLVSLYQLFMGMQTENWQPTQGVISVSRADQGFGGVWRVQVEYEYEVLGQPFEGDRIAYGRVTSWADVKELVKKYQEGQAATVYYDAGNPSNAVLKRGYSLEILWVIGLAALAIWGGRLAQKKAIRMENGR